MTTTQDARTSPAALLAILIAARKIGDRSMERAALRELRDEHGLRISFCRRPAKEARDG